MFNNSKTMKQLLFAAAIAGLFSSCTAELEKQNSDLQARVDSLGRELQDKEATLNAFDESFSQIQQNLELIADREEAIRANQGEITDDIRANITRDISAINTLLSENKQTIDRLNKSISGYKGEITGFKRLINQLNEDVTAKEQQIGRLKEDLTAANFTIEMLSVRLDSTELRNQLQADVIEMQANAMSEGYYAVGTYKELNDLGIVEKKGSIIGIAGNKTLKDDFNTEGFVKVDARQFKSLNLNSDKVQVVTNHPSESFEISGEEEKTLLIKDANRFWSASRYLVIIIG